MERRSLLILLGSVWACSRPKPSPRIQAFHEVEARPSELRSVRIDGIPHVRQKPDFCGEAATAMALRGLGKQYHQDAVFAMSGMDPARGMGATTRELRHALVNIGFRPGKVWHSMRAGAPTELARLFSELHADLERGLPSIVCMRYARGHSSTEHFRLVTGYDAEDDSVLYHEPAEDQGAYRRMPRARFLELWPLHYSKERWTVIRLRLEPGKIVPAPTFAGHSPADFAQHTLQLKERIPSGFTRVVQPPFLVLGDDAPERVRAVATRTVGWAVRLLRKDFFRRDPGRILDVWLFRNRQSYEHHNQALFGELPSTPYGYYSSRNDALVMNIATGGGTLVHEIVHPYVEANFPGCPAWLNEGLGSLYEQSAEREGRIVGLTNWRLSGLQRAIARRMVPSFRQLTSTTSAQFYEADPGTNYAQARYLLYYLQERQLLRPFYHLALANRKRDPTGYAALREVLGRPEMPHFEAKWRRFVLGLSFDG